jgi:hypothetical protein
MAKKIILDLMRPGKWNGIDVTPNFINQIQTATKKREYQNNKFPFVKGHPKDDDPAYGWGEKNNVFVDDDNHLKLSTSEESFQPEFLEDLKKKKFGPISIKLRPSDLSIKHIGFFGAVPTAVSGLEPAFSEEDKNESKERTVELQFKSCTITENENECVIEFAELEVSRYQLNSVSELFRNIKNNFIEVLGLEKANQLMPEYLLANVSEPLRVYDNEKNSFKENHTTKIVGDVMALTEQEIADLQAKAKKADDLEKENKGLKSKVTEFEEQIQFSEQEKKFNTALQFCESDEAKKRLTPVLQTRVAHLLSWLDNEESVLQFKEDKKDVKVKAADLIKELVGMLPELEFSEFAKDGKGEAAKTETEFKAGEEAAKRINGDL